MKSCLYQLKVMLRQRVWEGEAEPIKAYMRLLVRVATNHGIFLLGFTSAVHACLCWSSFTACCLYLDCVEQAFSKLRWSKNMFLTFQRLSLFLFMTRVVGVALLASYVELRSFYGKTDNIIPNLAPCLFSFILTHSLTHSFTCSSSLPPSFPISDEERCLYIEHTQLTLP